MGAGLIIILAVCIGLEMHGETAKRAASEARQRVGTGYKFFVNSLRTHSSVGHSHYTADVIAYSQKEIKEIPIEWEEE